MKRRGRPRKHPLPESYGPLPESYLPEAPKADPSEEIDVRLGLRPVMTSKGPSDGTHRVVRPGVVLPLPRHEAENLVSMGYATYA